MENYEHFFLLILHQKVKTENQSVTLNQYQLILHSTPPLKIKQKPTTVPSPEFESSHHSSQGLANTW
jgi:hypothetical protein